MPETSTSRLATARVPLVIGAVVIGGLIGYVGMVGMGASGGDPSCRPAVATAKKRDPDPVALLATDALSTLEVLHSARASHQIDLSGPGMDSAAVEFDRATVAYTQALASLADAVSPRTASTVRKWLRESTSIRIGLPHASLNRLGIFLDFLFQDSAAKMFCARNVAFGVFVGFPHIDNHG